MSDQLPVPAGGTAGGSLALPSSPVGDVSLDRGAPAATTRPAPLSVLPEIERELGVKLSPQQVEKAAAVLQRQRAALDERQRLAAVSALRAKWGPHYEAHIARIQAWLATLPLDLSEEIQDARDHEGTPICSKPPVLEAMLRTASKPTPRQDGDGRNRDERLAELNRWMGAPRGSADYRRYWGDPEAQAEYRELLDERSA